MQAVLGRAEEINVAAVPMPVLTATDLVIAWLASFSEHHADFAGALSCVRPLRGAGGLEPGARRGRRVRVRDRLPDAAP
jgi:hypothetical protein